MVDGTVNCKDNKEGKTRKVADIRMHHIIWIFFSKDLICCGYVG